MIDTDWHLIKNTFRLHLLHISNLVYKLSACWILRSVSEVHDSVLLLPSPVKNRPGEVIPRVPLRRKNIVQLLVSGVFEDQIHISHLSWVVFAITVLFIPQQLWDISGKCESASDTFSPNRSTQKAFWF